MPKIRPKMSIHGWVPTVTNVPTPLTSRKKIPKTKWWMWRPPGVTLPGHQRTPRRIIRTLKRMNRKEPMKPSSSRKSGCLPGSWMWWT